jgi:hypothetical protein
LQTVIRHLKDEDDEDKAEVQFASLDWGQEYCVSLKVAGNGGEFTSELSPEQCLLLPEQGKYNSDDTALHGHIWLDIFDVSYTGQTASKSCG